MPAAGSDNDDHIYRDMLESAPDAIVGVTADGLIAVVNAQTETLFGYSRAELIGQPVEILVPEAVRSLHPPHREKYFRHPTRRPMGAGMELSARRRDGTEFPAEISLSAIDTANGVLVSAAVRDVSERKRAELKFRGLLEAAPDAIVCISGDGRIGLVNAQTEALFGYSRHDLIGQRIDLLVPEAAREIELHQQEGGQPSSRHRAEFAGTELVGHRQDGTEFPAEISLSAIETEDGRVVAAAIRDGTERRQAAIIASSNDAIISIDLDGTIASWNAGAERLYGYRADQVLGKNMDMVIPPGRRAAETELRARVAAGGPAVDYETERLAADGTVVTVACALTAIREVGGRVSGLSSIAKDLTAHKIAEAEKRALEDRLQQSQRLESLGQLAGGVAHDFNNLLAVISSYASFVAEAVDGDETTLADVRAIQGAAERAAALTHQLLIFGRRETVQPQVLNLNSVVADIQNLLSRTLGEQIDLVVRPGQALPRVYADRGQIEQVLVNLAVNARDAMVDGGRLTIETASAVIDADQADLHPTIQPGRYVQVSVSDTGIGMAGEVASHAFEPFFSTKSRGAGSGLGLATVYGIVTEAGGGVSIYSEPGMGTTVRVYLPVARQAVSHAEAAAPPAEVPGGRGETVVVVEDEEAIRKVAARILRRRGYRVVEAADPEDALRVALHEPLHLLLSDVVMPRMSGVELAERVRSVRPDVAVLLMSGYSEGVLGPQRGLDPGVELLQKPFDEVSLLQKVAAALRSAPAPPPDPPLAD